MGTTTVSGALFSKKQAALRLGISPRTLTDLVSRGAIGHVRIGRTLRFTERQLERFVADRSVNPRRRPASR